MWDYILLGLSSILAIIGATLNTEKDELGKEKTVFKKPNAAGWFVIILLLSSTLTQISLQNKKDINDSENKRKEQKKDSILNARRVRDSLNIKYLKQKSTDDSLALKKQLNISSDILLGTDNLLHPILPMIAMFRIKVPFSNEWAKEYINRILKVKDSLEKKRVYGY